MADQVEIDVLFPDPIINDVVIEKLGPAGVGIPAGGTTGEQLAKNSNADFDIGWVPAGAAPAWVDITGKPSYVTHSADATHDGYLLQADWSTFNSKQAALGFTPENVSNKDTDGTLSSDSDTKYASQKATKTYVDGKTSSGANPTATVSGSAVNGTATTFMRSDAAPALANTAVTAASYGAANKSPSFTVDAQGRLTAAADVTITPLAIGAQSNRIYDVKDYGAAIDGTTDDTSAVTSALSALTSAGGGVLFFPHGTGVCKTTGGFTLTVPTVVLGDGGGTPQDVSANAISTVTSSSSSNSLFTVAANGCEFRNILLKCTAASPSAGAGITTSSNGEFTRYGPGLTVSGFYIDIDHQTGVSSSWNGMYLVNPVLYGLKLRNTANADGGDHSISNSWIYCGSARAATAALRIESGGGVKISNLKINVLSLSFVWTDGIELAVGSGVSTVDLLVSNSSIENYSGAGIKGTTTASATSTWKNIVLTGNQFAPGGSTTASGIDFNASTSGDFGNLEATGNVFSVGTSSSNAMVFTNFGSQPIVFGSNTQTGFAGLISSSSCTNILTPLQRDVNGSVGSTNELATFNNLGVGVTYNTGVAKALIQGDVSGTVALIRLRDANATRYRTDLTLNPSGGGFSLDSYDDTGAVRKDVNITGANIKLNLNNSGSAQVIGGTLILQGDQSATAWTTNGIRLKGISGTLTDTSSSGTVAAAYTNKLGGNTIAASSSTTFTNYISSYFSEPVAGTNVTLTNKWALGADSLYVGTSNPVKITSAGVLSATSPAFTTPDLGTPSAIALTNATSFPTLNQNTTGSAASLSVSGQTGLFTVTGLTSSNRAKTVRDAADTILELGGSYTPTGTWTNLTLVTPALGTPASGVVTNLTGTASININGTVGATTPAAGTFTTLSASGAGALITVPGSTSNSTLRVGTLEAQNFGLNNSWISDNIYYNGSNFQRRATGAATLFYFQPPEGQFRSYASGSAGTTVSNAAQLKTHADGRFGVGSSVSTTAGDFTGSNLYVSAAGGVSVGSVTDAGATNLAVTGTSTLSGGVIDGVQALSGAGAVNVTTGATAFTSTGSAQALTLANGTNGQRKTIAHVSDGGSGVLTPTTKSGYSTITFTNVGDAVSLQFFTTAGWIITGQNGVTVAP